MDDPALFAELSRVAEKLGVPVRVERFETPPAGAGGLCVVHGRPLVLLDARAAFGDRVLALARALGGLPVEDVYMAPDARAAIEAVTVRDGRPREQVPLAGYSTLGVGGPARYFLEAREEADVVAALGWAASRGVPVRFLGGGSNLVVADAGVDGLVVRLALRGVTHRDAAGGVVELTAAAGEPWDPLVARAVEAGWAGLECLSGIPGLAGATPIQNVGAYGQDVSETVVAVRALDRASGGIVTLDREACGFAYRNSAFKSRAPDRHVILSVTYRLVPGGNPAVRYAELARYLEARGLAAPSLAEVRAAVLAIRRAKSMVLDDAADENRRSCGSFFVNPIVTAADAAHVEARAGDPGMPRWPERDGRVKLSAAWLIERAGFRRGETDGPVGLSTRHSLALVAHAGATARDVVRLARRLRAGVEARFGVRLVPEPVFWGFGRLEDGLPPDPET
jgi:UDP-N-acetylmuramate dehydrogenase